MTAVKLEGQYFGREDEFKTPGVDPSRRGVPRRGRRRDDPRLRRPLRHLRLRLRQGRRPARHRPRQRPGGGHPGRRAAAPGLRPADQRRRQHPHPRRGDPARVPPARVGLVRRPQDQALARPGRPARLLQRGQRREQRGPRHPGPGRPDDHGQGKAHRRDLGRRRLFVGRQALAHGLDQAGEHLRLGQLPGPGDQHQQALQDARHQHDRSLLHDRRHLALARRLLPHHPADQQPGRGVQAGHPGRLGALRRSVQRVRHRVPRHRRRAHRDPRQQPAAQLLELPGRVRRDQLLGAADARLVARQPRQRPGADRGPLHPHQCRLGAARRREVPAPQPAGPAVHSR